MNYIEIIVLINVVIHYGLSRVSGYILGVKINKFLLFSSVILDCLYVVLYVLLPYEFEPYKYILIFLIAILPCLNKGIIRCLFYALIYLMLNFTLGGITEIVYKTISNFISVVISLFIILLICILILLYKRNKVNYDRLMYDIIISFNKKNIKLKGFCDTGNFLRDDDLIPIVFVKEKYKMGNFYKTIDVKTVNDVKKVEIYLIDVFKVKIKNRYITKDVYISFVDINYDVMFGIDILGG